MDYMDLAVHCPRKAVDLNHSHIVTILMLSLCWEIALMSPYLIDGKLTLVQIMTSGI